MSTPHVFSATSLDEVPPSCVRYASVDGSVPGARVTWDHHVTGEPINLDALPERIDPSRFDGVCTTHPDTDALASVVAVLAGGPTALPAPVLDVLRAASHRCDHLVAAPGLPPEVDAAGLGLHRWVVAALTEAQTPAAKSRVFGELCETVWARVQSGEPLPAQGEAVEGGATASELLDEGRLVALGEVGLADLRGGRGLDPRVLYETLDTALGVFVDDHPRGGLRYTVGRNPLRSDAPDDLGGLLRALARREHAHGPPCLAPEPVPGAENWGGRATVFGSPWNYGSRLSVREVVEVLGGEPEPGDDPALSRSSR